jgi:hypothetical protein
MKGKKAKKNCYRDLARTYETGRKDVEAAMNALIENHAGLQKVSNLLTEIHTLCLGSQYQAEICKELQEANNEVKHSRIGA